MTALPPESDDATDGRHLNSFLQRELITKELRETLRDRRTIITLLAMPILLYPMLGLGFRFLAVQEIAQENPEVRIGLATEEEATWLRDVLERGEELLQAESPTKNTATVQYMMLEDPSGGGLRENIVNGQADLGVRVSFDENRRDNSAVITFIQKSNSKYSQDAAAYVEDRLRVH